MQRIRLAQTPRALPTARRFFGEESSSAQGRYRPDPAGTILATCAQTGDYDKVLSVWEQYDRSRSNTVPEQQAFRDECVAQGRLPQNIPPPFDPVDNTMALIVDQYKEKGDSLRSAVLGDLTSSSSSPFNIPSKEEEATKRHWEELSKIPAGGVDGGVDRAMRQLSGWDLFRQGAMLRAYSPPAGFSPTRPSPDDPILVEDALASNPSRSGGSAELSEHDRAVATIMKHLNPQATQNRRTTSSGSSSDAEQLHHSRSGESVFTIRKDLTEVSLADSPFMRTLLVPPSIHALFLELLHQVTRRLDRAGLTWWVTGGTLLGCVRHEGMIPWDDDIDLCVLCEDSEEPALQGLQSEGEKQLRSALDFPVGMQYAPLFGYKVHHSGSRSGGGSARLPTPRHGCRHGVFLDLFTMRRRSRMANRDADPFSRVSSSTPHSRSGLYHIEQSRQTARDTWPNEVWPSDVLYPLKTYSFNGVPVKGPANPHAYLDAMYGKGAWETEGLVPANHHGRQLDNKVVLPMWQLKERAYDKVVTYQ